MRSHSPKHFKGKALSTSPFTYTVQCHQTACPWCCCCVRFGSLCGKQLLVCALVPDKHIRLLFTLL